MEGGDPLDDKLVDFKVAKEMKNGKAPPKYVVKMLYESMQAGETDPESIIYICKMKDGRIEMRYSDISFTEGIGMLHCGISYLLDEMRE